MTLPYRSAMSLSASVVGERRADVGQLDDVGLRGLGEHAQLAQRVANLLLIGQALRELVDRARGDADVAQVNLNARGVREFTDDREQGVRREHRGLVCVGVHDLGLRRHRTGQHGAL
jgi:hypothetical protein